MTVSVNACPMNEANASLIYYIAVGVSWSHT